jgi:hypothetical protein
MILGKFGGQYACSANAIASVIYKGDAQSLLLSFVLRPTAVIREVVHE